MAKLTQKQAKFALCYVQTGNASKSYIEAGYSAKTPEVAGTESHKLLKKPNIIEEIDRLNAQIEADGIASASERQRLLTNILRDVSEKTADRIRATEILGKMQGDFIERHEVKEVPIFMDDVTE